MPHSLAHHVETSTISIHSRAENPLAAHHLIFFITGNPGLIGYYNTFLSTLHGLLSANPCLGSDQVHVYGQSLMGFEDSDKPSALLPYSLEDQIQHSLSTLELLRVPSGPQKGSNYDSVTLIGHSVGSYILLELIQRLRKATSPINVLAGILLFPTVTHIAESPSGIKITKLFKFHDFPRKASFAAKSLLWLAPRRVLKWLVGLVTGMPADAAEVTVNFLRSKSGIWQALHMAKDEMDTITDDKWDEDLWGIEESDKDAIPTRPKLVFYFGQNDHWVADHTRDALISARAHVQQDIFSSKPLMIIDQNGIPHGFCIKHSEIIAERVSEWVIDFLKIRRRATSDG